MGRILFQYHAVSPTTWAYLSTLLMIGLFFKFSRFWSVRNLDLLLLSMLAPGLLLVHVGQIERHPVIEDTTVDKTPLETDAMDARRSAGGETDVAAVPALAFATPNEPVDPTVVIADDEDLRRRRVIEARGKRLEHAGYLWLFATGIVWLVRMMTDTRLTRRPLLSPNLSVGGMAFIGVALFVFLSGNVIYGTAVYNNTETGDSERAIEYVNPMNVRMEQLLTFQQPPRGPGYALLNALPHRAVKTMAILSHLAIVLGLAFVAYRHFGSVVNGVGAATLYLMIPYTSQMTGRIEHCLPAALMTWAIFYYRRPLMAGLLMGAAVGCIYYPLFLLPLWWSFYWKRGAVRFLGGVAATLLVLAVLLPLAPGSGGLVADLQRMFGVLRPAMDGLEGLWGEDIGGWAPFYRLPVLVACAVFACSLWLWPAQKNLGTLISCSAAVMLCSQFWHGYGGGLFIAWYLPLTLMMIFRPNLEDRVAQTMLTEGSHRRRGSAS